MLDEALRSQDGTLRFDVRLSDVKPVDLKIALFSGAYHAREGTMRALTWEDKKSIRIQPLFSLFSDHAHTTRAAQCARTCSNSRTHGCMVVH